MSTPQFGTAEYQSKQPDSCKLCGQPVGASYYRIGDAMACASCAERVQREGPKDSHAAFTRALLFGVGGAILGLILYSASVIITGWSIGVVSLAVGYIVAKAMLMGSKGIGGRRYQIAAALLTYAAVSISAIPISIYFVVNQRTAQQQVGTLERAPSDQQSSESQQQSTPKKPKMGMGEALFKLAMLGLASPFLDLYYNGPGAFLGLVILGIGIRIAWKLAEGKPATTVYGPFENSPATG